MNNDDAIKELAAYFTGNMVPLHSMKLSVGGMDAEVARCFFSARSALGIEGYAQQDEAEAAIRRTFA
jgi:hypothetical protein